PLLVACNKIDVMNLEKLEEQYPEKRAMITAIEKDNVPVLEMSTLTQEGVMAVKKQACDMLLAHRVDAKMRTKKADAILNRVHVAMPAQRDWKERKPCIPGKMIFLRFGAASRRT
ncbi:Nucleolar GTP-binding protein 1, partial [Halocaridina rubra]